MKCTKQALFSRPQLVQSLHSPRATFVFVICLSLCQKLAFWSQMHTRLLCRFQSVASVAGNSTFLPVWSMTRMNARLQICSWLILCKAVHAGGGPTPTQTSFLVPSYIILYLLHHPCPCVHPLPIKHIVQTPKRGMAFLHHKLKVSNISVHTILYFTVLSLQWTVHPYIAVFPNDKCWTDEGP